MLVKLIVLLMSTIHFCKGGPTSEKNNSHSIPKILGTRGQHHEVE